MPLLNVVYHQYRRKYKSVHGGPDNAAPIMLNQFLQVNVDPMPETGDRLNLFLKMKIDEHHNTVSNFDVFYIIKSVHEDPQLPYILVTAYYETSLNYTAAKTEFEAPPSRQRIFDIMKDPEFINAREFTPVATKPGRPHCRSVSPIHVLPHPILVEYARPDGTILDIWQGTYK